MLLIEPKYDNGNKTWSKPEYKSLISGKIAEG